ncbi:MAG: replicative DNA helicase [Alphaproteobacteria bacterium]|nr:replicative DNA helicase [Alphaproteobacteria bacterium]
MDARPTPQAVDAEQALLGGLLLDPEQYEEVEREVSAEDFYRPDHGRLFALLKEMRAEGEHVDAVTVGDRVLRGGQDEAFGGYGYVLGLTERVPSRANLGHYARLVREKASLRRVIRAAETVRESALGGEKGPSELLAQASHAFLEIADAESSRDWEQISEIIDRELTRIEHLSRSEAETPGVPTGYPDLDRILLGLHPSTLVVLAARPGMGKTALALNLALNVAVLGGRAVGIFSLEMDRGELANRLLCCAGMVEGGKVKTGKLSDAEWKRLDEADQHLRGARLFIDDTAGVTIEDLRARTRRLKAKHPDLGLVVLDYLQLMQHSDGKMNRQQQVTEISRGLKILAKELGVPVLALSQLNRAVESRADKRPLVSDLRESGAIEQDADVIMFIYRDEVYNPDSAKPGVAEVIVSKHRSGATGKVELVFRKAYTRFDSLEGQQEVSLR